MLGLMMVAQPDVGAIGSLHLMAIYAIGHGMCMLMFSKRLRRQRFVVARTDQ
jgi:uncharacterized membrane protein HdeD (DUF308 family)